MRPSLLAGFATMTPSSTAAFNSARSVAWMTRTLSRASGRRTSFVTSLSVMVRTLPCWSLSTRNDLMRPLWSILTFVGPSAGRMCRRSAWP
ncbi:MAG: hypothetical protein DME12_18175 [Candidatus Rokuibacteriota bacterium]|nr:MAG: hypothetical protein DME12_18175 [Candidatus Rokubacteria bacterium]